MLSAGGVGEHAVLDERRDRERGRDSSGEQASFVVYQCGHCSLPNAMMSQGHNLPDRKGNRYCINLVSVAGTPTAAGEEK
jgi:hypothetical protein